MHAITWRSISCQVVGPAGRLDNINYQGLVPVPSLRADFSHPICKIAGVDNVSGISAALPLTQ